MLKYPLITQDLKYRWMTWHTDRAGNVDDIRFVGLLAIQFSTDIDTHDPIFNYKVQVTNNTVYRRKSNLTGIRRFFLNFKLLRIDTAKGQYLRNYQSVLIKGIICTFNERIIYSSPIHFKTR